MKPVITLMDAQSLAAHLATAAQRYEDHVRSIGWRGTKRATPEQKAASAKRVTELQRQADECREWANALAGHDTLGVDGDRVKVIAHAGEIGHPTNERT